MLDISGSDIAQLGDADLRTLVARLARAEVGAGGGKESAVTAGGHQDAADGGIDVAVNQSAIHGAADFVPAANVGFQVKLPDLGRKEILREMKPNGTLRPAIADLIAAGGAYIIVSATANVTGPRLEKRREAIREAVADHPDHRLLKIDFYDRDQLAAWVAQYPGVAAWLRRQIGRQLAGWGSVGIWQGLNITDRPYLVDGGLTLTDERAGSKVYPIANGIDVLRSVLREPGGRARLVGLSGVGKTRLVQALFESGVGDTPLDPAISVYTDYADDAVPSPWEMAESLVRDGRRAVLVVENCNSRTHQKLAAVCDRGGKNVSLLTVEYDVRLDEPEETQVFRLQSASDALITRWLKRDYPNVSQANRARLATISSGNFRVAAALAGTIRRNERISHLRGEDLFERIFHQRNDPDSILLRHAEALSLFYSFDAREDDELSHIASLQGATVDDLHRSVVRLKDRGLAQARGRWRAVLPHAIANRLAASAIRHKTPRAISAFVASLPDRMFRSFSKRMAFLLDAEEARQLAAGWLEKSGPVGDLLSRKGIEEFRNLAPLAPKVALLRIESTFESEAAIGRLDDLIEFGCWVELLVGIADDDEFLPKVIDLIIKLIEANYKGIIRSNAEDSLERLFNIRSSSIRTPKVRYDIVISLLRSGEPSLLRGAYTAIAGLLQGGNGFSNWTQDSAFDSLAAVWNPPPEPLVDQWYSGAIALVVNHVQDAQTQRRLLADAIPGIWAREACRIAIGQAAEFFAENGGWLEGWLALRKLLREYAGAMSKEARIFAETLIERLMPVGSVECARADVLLAPQNGAAIGDAYDAAPEGDSTPMWERLDKKARDAGERMARNLQALAAFLPAALKPPMGHRCEQFAAGLVQEAEDVVALWDMLTVAFRTEPVNRRSPALLCYVLRSARERDASFVNATLDAAISDPDLGRYFPYLQGIAGLDERGVDRLIAAVAAADDLIHFRRMPMDDFPGIAPESAARLVRAISERPTGGPLAIKILGNRFSTCSWEVSDTPSSLADLGRHLLTTADLSDYDASYYLRQIAVASLSGEESREDARLICERIYDQAASAGTQHNHLVGGLFEVQPHAALDVFVDGLAGPAVALFQEPGLKGHPSPLGTLTIELLGGWANRDPIRRYPRLGACLSLFAGPDAAKLGLDPIFLELLANAPSKGEFLGSAIERLRPRDGMGWVVNIVDYRLSLMDELSDDPEIAAWRAREQPGIDSWLVELRKSNLNIEQSFE